jgi:Spy/CpxP family protein refolding chaperone
MKRNLLTLSAIGSAIALGGFAFAQAENQGSHGPGGHGAWHGDHGSPLEHITETLGLTPDQAAKVQPIVDQAKPQIIAIHQEAMQKTKAIMDNVMSQIRPLLTPEQQAKADNMQKAHQDMMNAAKEMHDARTK